MEEFIHLPEYCVIICKTCHHAVLPQQVNTHLQGTPHHLSQTTRQRTIREIANISGLIQNTQELQVARFPFPSGANPPIPALGPPRIDGFQCISVDDDGLPCDFVVCTTRAMQQHCEKVHHWKNPRRQGRRSSKDPREPPETPWTPVSCQRFFIQGPKSKYFPVNRPTPSHVPIHAVSEETTNIIQQANRELTDANVRVEQHEQETITAINENQEPSPWLRKTGWTRHLQGLDQKQLIAAIAVPVDPQDEGPLEEVQKAFARIIQKARRVARAEVVGRSALVAVNQKEQGKRATKPFNAVVDRTTIPAYNGVWFGLIRFWVRVRDWDEGKRPKFEYTERQRRFFHAVRRTASQLSEVHSHHRMPHHTDSVPEDEEDGYIIGMEDGGDDSGMEGSDTDREDSTHVSAPRHSPHPRRSHSPQEPAIDEDTLRDKLEERLLAFIIAMLDHPLKDSDFSSGLVSGLAVTGLREDGGWCSAEEFTPKLSAIVKWARLLVLYQAYRQEENERKEYESAGWKREDIIEKCEGYASRVRKSVTRFMLMSVDTQPATPIDYVYEVRTYGMKIRYTSTAEGVIHWKGSELLYQQIRLDVDKLRAMVNGLTARLRRQLVQGLLMLPTDGNGDEKAGDLPAINWDQWYDNPAEDEVGWSFLKDERSTFSVDGTGWLWQRMLEEKRLRKRFIKGHTETGTIAWKMAHLKKYQRLKEDFQQGLLCIAHLVGGQPGRATEIIGLRHRNTSNGGIRNVFIYEGVVMFVTAYHKGYQHSAAIKVIQRFLPREVGELMVYYLWLVLPFWENLQKVAGGVAELSPFIWGDPKSDEIEDAESDEASPAAQNTSHHAAHPVPEPAPPPVFAQRPWTSERLRKIMQRESEQWMKCRVNISAWRHIAIAMARQYLHGQYQFQDETRDGDDDFHRFDEDNIHGDSPLDLQAGHGTHVAGMIYAREISSARVEIAQQRGKFHQVSHAWHRLLEFPSAVKQRGPFSKTHKRVQSQWESNSQELQRRRWIQQSQIDIRPQLQRMFGPQAQFRGVQYAAINAIMQNQSPILVVMGTGGGKSLTFMLPAFINSVNRGCGVSVVIIPLVSLQGDLQERCRRAGISNHIWNVHNPYRKASIVFVTPESAISKTFAGFVNRLNAMYQLDRIVIDECHTILDSSNEFRPKMQQLGELVFAEVQMVHLTATLPPRDEAAFRKRMNIDGQVHVHAFRCRTTRRNVAYQVQYIGSGDRDEEGNDHEDHALQAIIAAKCEQYPAPAKIIVYSSSVDRVKDLADVLDCNIFHAKIGNREHKMKQLQAWIHGRSRSRVMVSTNALGLGIDVPDIRVVIHIGRVFKLQDYAQESGRAGRDGKRSEAIILQPGDGPPAQISVPHCAMDIKDYMHGELCRRVVLDEVMDGYEQRIACEEGEEICDVCQATCPAHIPSPDAERSIGSAPRSPQMSAEIVQCAHPSSSPAAPMTDVPRPGCHPGSASIHDDSGIGSGDNSSVHQATSQRCSSEISEVSEDGGFQNSHVPPRNATIDNEAVHRQPYTLELPHQQLQQRRQDEALENRTLIEQLEIWGGGICTWCFVQRRDDANEHRLAECPHPGATTVRGVQGDMKKTIQFARFSGCFECGVPQGICQRWQEHDGPGKWKRHADRVCQHSSVVFESMASIAVASHQDDAVKAIVEGYLQGAEWDGIDTAEMQVMCDVWGQRVVWGEYESNQFTQGFCHIGRQVAALAMEG